MYPTILFNKGSVSIQRLSAHVSVSFTGGRATEADGRLLGRKMVSSYAKWSGKIHALVSLLCNLASSQSKLNMKRNRCKIHLSLSTGGLPQKISGRESQFQSSEYLYTIKYIAPDNREFDFLCLTYFTGLA